MRLLSVALLLLVLLAPAVAEPFGEVVLAEQLADYGIEKQDPEALLVAAKILIANRAAVFQGEGREEADEGADPRASAVEKAPLYRAEALLDRAGELTTNPELRTRIEALRKELERAGKSPRSGVVRGSQSVRSRHRWSTEVEFVGQEKAQVEVLGEPGAELQLLIYDEDGQWITGKKESGPRCHVSWKAARDGLFKVVVRNRGAEPARFRFVLQ
ncbi:MAG: hypothetical protein KC910_04335 [Candidatus Eremiobacteraeota bacterium]|nr:hypothetical protein [Candidatus Eremiobacteraeota bacterium]